MKNKVLFRVVIALGALLTCSIFFPANAEDYAFAHQKDAYIYRENGMYGIKNVNDSIIAAAQYDAISPFLDNHAMIIVDGCFGCLNLESGVEIIPPIYESLEWINPDSNGAKFLIFKKNNKYGILNILNKVIIDAEYDMLLPCSDNYIRAQKDNKQGLLTMNGEIIIPLEWDYVNPPSNGYVLVINEEQNEYQFLNITSSQNIPQIFDYAGSFFHDRAIVQKNNNFYILDNNGNSIASPKVDLISWQYENGYVSYRINKHWGFIDKDGVKVTEPIYDYVGSFSENGLANVKINGKWGYINTKGDLVIPAIFDFALPFHEAHAIVKLEKKYGLITSDGSMIIQCQWNDISIPSNGLIAVQDEQNLWGYINLEGETVIDCQYVHAENFRNGIAHVWCGSYASTKTCWIDIAGNIICPGDYWTYYILSTQ